MASLRRKLRSPFWFACFTGVHGRVQRSTKQSDRRKAQTVADKWEKAAKLASEKHLGEAQARRVLSEIYEALNNEPLASSTVRAFLNGWTERRKVDTAPRTQAAYAQVARDFMVSLGDRADRDISQVSKSDVARYRDVVLKRTSVATANKALKYLRVALGAAHKDGFSQDNPASKLDVLKRRHGDGTKRRPFTIPEVKALLANASPEWKGIILFGFYTGQRLKDIARLTWHNIDMETESLRFITGKTGAAKHHPLARPLVELLEAMPAGDDPAAPLFPAAHAIATGPKDASRLSQQFYGIMLAAGLATGERKSDKRASGEGRSSRRTVNELSFHCLRHTSNSLLKNAGVPDSIVMDLIGHDSVESSAFYTHIDHKAKRKALAKLPDVTT